MSDTEFAGGREDGSRKSWTRGCHSDATSIDRIAPIFIVQQL